MKQNKENLVPLWGRETKTPIEQNENKDNSPECPVCKKKMKMFTFADGSQGFACTCLSSKNNTKNILTEND